MLAAVTRLKHVRLAAAMRHACKASFCSASTHCIHPSNGTTSNGTTCSQSLFKRTISTFSCSPFRWVYGKGGDYIALPLLEPAGVASPKIVLQTCEDRYIKCGVPYCTLYPLLISRFTRGPHNSVHALSFYLSASMHRGFCTAACARANSGVSMKSSIYRLQSCT